MGTPEFLLEFRTQKVLMFRAKLHTDVFAKDDSRVIVEVHVFLNTVY